MTAPVTPLKPSCPKCGWPEVRLRYDGENLGSTCERCGYNFVTTPLTP
jgi:uncharacterized Zn finger protein (UPF0148 family)